MESPRPPQQPQPQPQPQPRRLHQRPRSARAPPSQLHPPHRQNPTRDSLFLSPSAAADAAGCFPFQQRYPMEDDAISTLMDIDDSPLNAGFLDEEDGEGEMMYLGQHRMGRGAGNEQRGPLPFTGFFNSFDGADFDDADLD
ncbi:hypothetical protein ACP4OV_006077 [Aristida adscensionis]